MSIYYRGSGLTWEGYLQADSFVQDVTGQIKRSGEGVKTAISDSTRRMVASNEALERSFGAGFDRVNGTLEWGFDRVAGELGALRSEFSYGMGLLHDQMRIMNEALSGILDRLDQIHETLKHPLLTQARELSKRGLERLRRGLLPEALEDLLESAEKNKADFLVQYQVGKLYLYGRNEMDSVIDLSKAEEHLRLAARYAQSEMRGLPDAAKFCGEAYLHASIACYAQSNEHWQAGDRDGAIRFTREALDLSQKVTQACPDLAEGFYHHAKYAALLGERETCARSLKGAILMERNYCLKADADGDFDGVRESVLALEDSLRNEAKATANAAYRSYRQKLDVILSDLPSDTRWEAERDCQRIEVYLARDTYFDYQDVLPEIGRAEGKLPAFREALETKVKAGNQLASVKHLLDDYVFLTDEAKRAEAELRRLFQQAETRYRQDTCADYRSVLDLLKQVQETFNPSPYWEIATLTGHGSYVRSVAFSPDGKLLASGSRDNTVKLWSVTERREMATLTGHGGLVHSVAFSPDGGLLASGSRDNTVKLWSVTERREIATLTGHSNHVTSVAFSPDGGLLASGSDDNTVKLWSVSERREVATLTGHSDLVRSVAFSPDGGLLASGSVDHTVKLWSVRERREIAALTGHSSSVTSVAFSPDGRLLASGSADTSVKLWSVSERREVATLTGHRGSVYSVSFSPDGRLLASGSDDNTVKLWSVSERREIATLTGHSNSVYSVAFSPDGRLLASGSYDNCVKLWGKPVLTRQEFEEGERQRRLAEEARRKWETEEAEARRKREAEAAERLRREQEAAELRAHRQENKLCLACGAKLGFWDKLGGGAYCKGHRR